MNAPRIATGIANGIATGIATLAALACWSIATARADAVADFYRDKTVTLVSAGEAGGAHGAYAQLITTHIRKHIPGNPNVVIQYILAPAAISRPITSTMWRPRTAPSSDCRCRT